MRSLRFLMPWILLAVIPLAVIGQKQPPARASAQERELALRVRYVGVVDYDRIADVVPEVSGVIRMLHMREAQRVKQGDVLVELATDFIEQYISVPRILARAGVS